MPQRFEFDPEQLKAIENWDQCLWVQAPVGTGKTEVLTARIIKAIEEGINPSKILSISFTNKAAKNIQRRVSERVPHSSNALVITTFHALCSSILRKESYHIGFNPEFTILDEEEIKDLLWRTAIHFGILIPTEKAHRREFQKVLLGFINSINPNFLNAEEYSEKEIESYLLKLFQSSLNFARLPKLNLNQNFFLKELYQSYNRYKSQAQALDFNDLVNYVTFLFNKNDDTISNWRDAFEWIQVDEMQDTSLKEYEVLKFLANSTKRLSLFGDPDQTIYEWRGSQPLQIKEAFQKDFEPVLNLQFIRNYRSTSTILKACSALIGYNNDSQTKEMVTDENKKGEKIKVIIGENETDEYYKIAKEIVRLNHEERVPFGSIALLVRTNFTGAMLSNKLNEVGIPHYLIDEYKFFRRLEIKDALAYLRILINPFDIQSLKRIVKELPNGIGKATLKKIQSLPREWGLRLTDFIDERTHNNPDLYAKLFENLDAGEVVILDTETTGLNPNKDEVLEVCAVRVKRSEGKILPVEHYCVLIQPENGLVEGIHGISEEEMTAKGISKLKAFQELEKFVGNSIIVGHNILFDIKMLNSEFTKTTGSSFELERCYDTLSLTRHFYKLLGYKLENLTVELNLTKRKSHRAYEDCLTTVELLEKLVEKIQKYQSERIQFLNEVKPKFLWLSNQISIWKKEMYNLRPAQLLEKIIYESGLWEFYERKRKYNQHREAIMKEEGSTESINIDESVDEVEIEINDPRVSRRLGNLKELVDIFSKYDNQNLKPVDSLIELVTLTHLGNGDERFLGIDEKVMLITAHQSKGLEFNTVFIVSSVQGEYPSWKSIKENRLSEERRLFYVAMTRAKERLYISFSKRYNEKIQEPSQFLSELPIDLLERM
ncbi:MAG: 3'-5' exonuclease [Chloroherpetonaceae bacterium]|nr:3'-5' exonuclease [Chloroherpetonaceae bacterium]